jgi:hypothetical protein
MTPETVVVGDGIVGRSDHLDGGLVMSTCIERRNRSLRAKSGSAKAQKAVGPQLMLT